MSHEWHNGAMVKSSWHQLETLVDMSTAEEMIAAGESTNAWPVELVAAPMFASVDFGHGVQRLKSGARGIVASYASAPPAVVGTVGARYRATACEEWRQLVTAAVKAGAKPDGAFALNGGSKVLATFNVESGDIRTNLMLVDSFDGSTKLCAGFTSVRVVCANTLSMAWSGGFGATAAQLRHTASLESKVQALAGAIESSVQGGRKVRETFDAASKVQLSREEFRAAFDLLFPEAPKDATDAQKTKAENMRLDAARVGRMPINSVGAPGNLATLWNAATYLVDRNANGTVREARGGADKLDSLLFGSRGERVQEVQTLIEVILRDGKVQTMTAPQALSVGVAPNLVGRQLLADAIAEADGDC